MKKMIFGITLALAALTANAQLSAITNYDYERADSATALHSSHLGQVGMRYTNQLGSFDLLGSVKQNVAGERTHASGAEVAFNKPIRMGDVTVVGTAAVGVMDSEKFYRLGAEGYVKLLPKVEAFGGYRFTNRLGSNNAVDATNRYALGVKVAVAQNIDAKVGLTQTRFTGEKYNGITSGVEVKF